MRRNRGFTILEILISLVILLIGILALARLFPISLRANKDGQDLITATFLAQQKIEELRRDNNDLTNPLIDTIRALVTPQPPIDKAIPFPQDPDFKYTFCGRSQIYKGGINDPNNPDDDPNVPRVIIVWNDGKKIFEMRFDK